MQEGSYNDGLWKLGKEAAKEGLQRSQDNRRKGTPTDCSAPQTEGKLGQGRRVEKSVKVGKGTMCRVTITGMRRLTADSRAGLLNSGLMNFRLSYES